MISPNYSIVLSLLLFFIDTLGIFLRPNLLVMFMCIELMLNSVSLAFVTFSRMYQNLEGQVFVFFVIVVAAAEATVGLAIILHIFRSRKTIDVARINYVKG